MTQDDKNPYRAPPRDVRTELRIKRQRRKWINLALTTGVAVFLFIAIWLGAYTRVIFDAFNDWLIGR